MDAVALERAGRMHRHASRRSDARPGDATGGVRADGGRRAMAGAVARMDTARWCGSVHGWRHVGLGFARAGYSHHRRRAARRRRHKRKGPPAAHPNGRSEEHTSELQSLMRISYAVFCLKKKTLYHDTIKLHMHSLPLTQFTY